MAQSGHCANCANFATHLFPVNLKYVKEGAFLLWELDVAKCLIFLKTLNFQVPIRCSDAGLPHFLLLIKYL